MRGRVLLTTCAHRYHVNTYYLELMVDFIMYVFYDYDDGKVDFIMDAYSNTS